MVTSNGDKNTVENDESCFGWLRDHRVRHKKVHLFIFFFSNFHKIISCLLPLLAISMT